MKLHSYVRVELCIIAAISFGIALPGCDRDFSAGNRCGEGESFVFSNFVELSPDAGAELVYRNDTILVFSLVGPVPKLQPGYILVGEGDGGFLARIVSAREVGAKLVVEIEPAYATDVIACGSGEMNIRFGTGSSAHHAIASSNASLGENSFRLVSAASGVSFSSGGISLRDVVLFDGDVGGRNVSVVIDDGRVSFEPELRCRVGFAPKKVNEFLAEMSGNCELFFEAQVSVDGPCEVSAITELASFEADAIFRVGNFPVVARALLKYNASVSMHCGSEGISSLEAVASGSLCFGSQKHGGSWREQNRESLVLGEPAVELSSGSATSITIGIWPSFELEFYGARTVSCSRSIEISYAQWQGAAHVLEWQKKGSMGGHFAFESGNLDANESPSDLPFASKEMLIKEGPYKTDEYILATIWGRAGTGPGQFVYPKAVAVDDEGSVFVLDSGNDRIQRFTSDGIFLSSWGVSGSAAGQLDSPEKISVCYGGNIFVTDSGNKRVQVFTRDGEFVSAWGSEGLGAGEFLHPYGLACAPGCVFVTDYFSHRVQSFTPDGIFLSQWGSQGRGTDQFDGPAGCAWVPGGAGKLVICDSRNDRVGVFYMDGTVERWFGSSGSGDGFFMHPVDVACGEDGRIFVCDLGNDRIQIFSPSGTFLGKLGSSGSAEGEFDHPEGLALDSRGNLYVADARNGRIQKFAPRFE